MRLLVWPALLFGVSVLAETIHLGNI